MIDNFSKDFIEKLVQKPVRDFTTSFGSGKGDNVAGDLLSITVTTKSGAKIYLIYKSVPAEGGVNRDYAEYEGLFHRENLFYSSLLPMMTKLMENRGLTTKIAVPKFYGGSAENYREFICLEDLRPVGNFNMASKWTGLGFEETNLVMTELAKFHAVSHVLIRMEGEKLFERSKDFQLLKRKRFGYLPDCDASEVELLSKLFVAGTELIEKRDSSLARKMRDFDYGTNMTSIMKTATLTDSKYFPVIIHGDLWVNNILFQYSEQGLPQALKFIDFQKVGRGNIYQDLEYFMFTSTTPQLREKYLPQLLNAYYDSFKSTLDNMKWPIPANFTRGAFTDGFHEASINGYRYMFLAIPFQIGVPVDMNFDCEVPEENCVDKDGEKGQNGYSIKQNGGKTENGNKYGNGGKTENSNKIENGHPKQNGGTKLDAVTRGANGIRIQNGDSANGNDLCLQVGGEKPTTKFFKHILFDPLKTSLENSPQAIDRIESLTREMVTLNFL